MFGVVCVEGFGIGKGGVKEDFMQAVELESVSLSFGRTPVGTYQLMSQCSSMEKCVRDTDCGPLPRGDLIRNAYCISLGDFNLLLVQKLVDVGASDIFLFVSRRDLGESP